LKELAKVLNEREKEAYEMQMSEYGHNNETKANEWRAYRRAIIDIANDLDIKLEFQLIGEQNENHI